jgi:hypothetical protein
MKYEKLKKIPIHFLEKDFFHVHIPKTGGSSINRAFENANWFINGGHCSFLTRNTNNRIEGFFQKKATKNFEEKGYQEKKHISFAVIRDPYEWLRSIYWHRSNSSKFSIKYKKQIGWGNILRREKPMNFEHFVIDYCLGRYDNKEYLIEDMLMPIKDEENNLRVNVIVRNDCVDLFINELSKLKQNTEPDLKRLNISNIPIDFQLSSFAAGLLKARFKEVYHLFNCSKGSIGLINEV